MSSRKRNHPTPTENLAQPTWSATSIYDHFGGQPHSSRCGGNEEVISFGHNTWSRRGRRVSYTTTPPPPPPSPSPPTLVGLETSRPVSRRHPVTRLRSGRRDTHDPLTVTGRVPCQSRTTSTTGPGPRTTSQTRTFGGTTFSRWYKSSLPRREKSFLTIGASSVCFNRNILDTRIDNPFLFFTLVVNFYTLIKSMFSPKI